MKKRSLFAAVAMLIVSAILLTSSTYAWFAAQHEATVSKVIATVDGKDKGNVMVSTTENGTYKTSLTAEELYQAGNGRKALDPIDIANPASSVSSCKVADFDTLNFKVSDGDTGSMLTYSFWVKATGDSTQTSGKKIVIPVSFTSGSCLYGVVAKGGTLTGDVYGAEGDSYVPIASATSAVDNQSAGTKGVIDSNDTITPASGGLATTAVAADGTSGTIEITSNITTPTQITVYVWAEGQDTDCVGTKTVNDGGFTFGTANTGSQTGNGIHLEDYTPSP